MKKFIITIFLIFISPLASFAQSEINIAFTIDNNYAPFTMIAINSILKKNISNSHYNFYIFTDNLSFINKFLLKTYVKWKKQNIEIITCSTDIIDNGKSLQEGILGKEEIYISRIGTARILIPELLPNVEKILYLDPDILVLSDLKELYVSDLQDKSMGMVSDVLFFDPLTYDPNKYSYVNSGVILIDAEKWRQKKITEKMVKYAQEHPQLEFIDQNIFNDILTDDIKMLDLVWNNQWLIDRDKILTSANKKGIWHYSYRVKPWNFLPHDSVRKQRYLQNWSSSILALYQAYYLPQSIISIYKGFIKDENEYLKNKEK